MFNMFNKSTFKGDTDGGEKIHWDSHVSGGRSQVKDMGC